MTSRITRVLLLFAALMLQGEAGRAAPHPTGDIQPAAARRIGMAADVGSVDCLSCHVAHGAPDETMLTEDARTKDCVACHTRQVPRHDGAGHPLGETVSDRSAVKAVVDRGLFVGEGNTVVCLSCHTIHEDSAPNASCDACHRDQAPVRGKDLVHDSGKCLECHSVHPGVGKVAVRVPSAGDPSGCLACHGASARHEPAASRPGARGHALVDRPGGPGQTDPPLEGCESCHQSHGQAMPGVALCGECHDGQVEEQARGGHGTATCLDCHPAHQETPLADELPADLNPVTRRCQACHSPEANSGDIARVSDYEHPAPNFLPDGQRWTPLGGLPLYDKSGRVVPPGENGDLTCSSCHVTHGPDRAKPGSGLRRPGMDKPCAACHGKETLEFYLYFHVPERRKAG